MAEIENLHAQHVEHDIFKQSTALCERFILFYRKGEKRILIYSIMASPHGAYNVIS